VHEDQADEGQIVWYDSKVAPMHSATGCTEEQPVVTAPKKIAIGNVVTL
jgi:hypothetical protein